MVTRIYLPFFWCYFSFFCSSDIWVHLDCWRLQLGYLVFLNTWLPFDLLGNRSLVFCCRLPSQIATPTPRLFYQVGLHTSLSLGCREVCVLSLLPPTGFLCLSVIRLRLFIVRHCWVGVLIPYMEMTPSIWCGKQSLFFGIRSSRSFMSLTRWSLRS